jgi:4-hydroxy-tetrahydrodipicolinate reductase
MIHLVLVGAAGRMGAAVEQAVADTPGFVIKARVDRAARQPAGATGWTADAAGVLGAGDVAVEFSDPAACAALATLCAERGAGLVSGTTGLDPAQDQAVRAAARRVAVVRGANFSLGVAALRRALRAALAALPPGWDVEIVERHHRLKADSPSGTALALAADVVARRGGEGSAPCFGRGPGRTGPRPAGEIGMHSVRGGTWVGDHTVLLAGEGEWLELRHIAQDRLAFAHGALAAARFVAGAGPGLYTLEDALAAGGHPQ